MSDAPDLVGIEGAVPDGEVIDTAFEVAGGAEIRVAGGADVEEIGKRREVEGGRKGGAPPLDTVDVGGHGAVVAVAGEDERGMVPFPGDVGISHGDVDPGIAGSDDVGEELDAGLAGVVRVFAQAEGEDEFLAFVDHVATGAGGGVVGFEPDGNGVIGVVVAKDSAGCFEVVVDPVETGATGACDGGWGVSAGGNPVDIEGVELAEIAGFFRQGIGLLETPVGGEAILGDLGVGGGGDTEGEEGGEEGGKASNHGAETVFQVGLFVGTASVT